MNSLVIAMTYDEVIGIDGGLPWNSLPRDMKRFKDLTINKNVIMGRKTWESLPDSYRPLPDRKNYVITNNEDYRAEGAICTKLTDEIKFGKNDFVVIGGAKLISHMYPYIDKINLTIVHNVIPRDSINITKMPKRIITELKSQKWIEHTTELLPAIGESPMLEFKTFIRR